MSSTLKPRPTPRTDHSSLGHPSLHPTTLAGWGPPDTIVLSAPTPLALDALAGSRGPPALDR
ncbi:hypothetical protein [Saccharopolyspora tripterygii]